jgi:signal transduction histidine kinase
MTYPARAFRSPCLQDLGLAVLVAVLVLIGFGVSVEGNAQLFPVGQDADSRLPGPTALLDALVEALPLTFRRVAPVLVFVLVASVSVADEVLNRRPEPLALPVLVALYTVATTRRPVIVGIASAAYVTALATAAVNRWAEVPWAHLYVDLIAVAAAVALGYGVRLTRARSSLAEQRNSELTRLVETRAQQAVEQEQARIAREMHDNLAHHLSVIVAQATAARRVYGDRPGTATDALGSIETVARDALSGVRRLVGLLRVDREPPDGGPQPGLDRLGTLVDQLRSAGLPIELTVRGRPGPLPEEVELNALRLIQEALTNSLKYAGLTGATVTLAYAEDSLDIEVRNAGRRGSPSPDRARGHDEPSGGYGLISMRQRVAMLGGELTAGPDGPQGFMVRARLPVERVVG